MEEFAAEALHVSSDRWTHDALRTESSGLRTIRTISPFTHAFSQLFFTGFPFEGEKLKFAGASDAKASDNREAFI